MFRLAGAAIEYIVNHAKCTRLSSRRSNKGAMAQAFRGMQSLAAADRQSRTGTKEHVPG